MDRPTRTSFLRNMQSLSVTSAQLAAIGVAPACAAHPGPACGGTDQVLVRRSVQYHLTDWFNE
jgi:hypothetical protein